MVELTLSPMEQRILGALMEKQVTVPTTYPLSLNALRTACNQTSSRDPVTTYEDRELEQSARELKHRELIRVVVADRGQRTLKYHQRLDEHLDLVGDERALLTVLLLRGPNAPGELKTRTERLHPFADRGEVEDCLARMAERGLVRELPRRAGQHDNRWVHLLGPIEAETAALAQVEGMGMDREAVLSEGSAARDARVKATYDAVAGAYAEALADELDAKPLDRWLLERVAVEAGSAPVADVGCGPGHVTAYLSECGADVSGYDVSAAMVAEAGRRFPELPFEVGDLRRLLRPPMASGWGAITAWYALVHLAPSELAEALAALARVLRPGGLLAVALHVGDGVRHAEEFFGAAVDVDFVLHDPVQVLDAASGAGLTVQEWYVRGPYADAEVATDRLYVLAKRAAG